MERVLTLPFRLRGHDELVSVSYGVNDDPTYWGFDLFKLPFDLSLVRGFPLMQATVIYAGPGYRALMGWVQVVTVEERMLPRTWASVDVYPMHWETDTPFVEFGHAPATFDAPGPNSPRASGTLAGRDVPSDLSGRGSEPNRDTGPLLFLGLRAGADARDAVPASRIQRSRLAALPARVGRGVPYLGVQVDIPQ